MAIIDWRQPNPTAAPSVFDQIYLASNPSFRARHASLEETEELLLVKGMTPELYHGSYVRDAAGRLQPRAGLKDCVSVYGSGGPFDINSAQPAMMATIGISPEVVTAIQQRRYANPFRNGAEIAQFAAVWRAWHQPAQHWWEHDIHASVHSTASRWRRPLLGHDAHRERRL